MRVPLYCSVCVIALGLSAASPSARAGVLEDLREEARGDKQDEEKKADDAGDTNKDKDDHHDATEHHHEGHHERHDTAAEPLDDAAARLWLAIITAPWWLPHQAVGDTFGTGHAFAAFPYAEGHTGLVLTSPEQPSAEGGSSPVAGYVMAEGAYRNDGLRRAKLEAHLHTSSRVGLATGVATYFEKLEDGRLDRLSLADANLTFTFARSLRTLFWTGLGTRVLAEARPTFGFNFVYGADLFIAKPLVLSLRLDLGSLGHAGVAGAGARLGLLVNRFDLGVGYDGLIIGKAHLGGVSLGVRTWF